MPKIRLGFVAASILCLTLLGYGCADDSGGDTDGGTDAGAEPCEGYTGAFECCAEGNPCGWGADGMCDCDGTCSWDSVDCDVVTPCEGYLGTDGCCNLGNSCGLAEDGTCDCDGTCSWDSVDCGGEQDAGLFR
jgi:hypothetical protein